MTTLEVDVNLDDWPETYERDHGPFRLALSAGTWVAEAPIGIWRLPHEGERLTSAWPAEYAGPLKPARRWELRAPTGETITGGRARFPRLHKLDTMSVTVTLRGRRCPGALEVVE